MAERVSFLWPEALVGLRAIDSHCRSLFGVFGVLEFGGSIALERRSLALALEFGEEV